MRIEIAGAQVTEAVVDVLETLQNQPEIVKTYIDTIDYITRSTILDIEGGEESDMEVMARLRALQMLRRDILAISSPPDVDLPSNDNPTFIV